ncbi:hypothetical protein GS504_01310 [Rhodococcus hoagii]|nr:hypothetical protein [Prescottella equi]NKS71689.1 hypothetical protein [Prescottella equi]
MSITTRTPISDDQRRAEALAIKSIGWTLTQLDISVATLCLDRTSSGAHFPDSFIREGGRRDYVHQLPGAADGLADVLDEYCNLLPSDCSITAMRCGEHTADIDVATAARVRVPGYGSNGTDAHTPIIEAVRASFGGPIRSVELLPESGSEGYYSRVLAVTGLDGAVDAVSLTPAAFDEAMCVLHDLYDYGNAVGGFLIPVNDRP